MHNLKPSDQLKRVTFPAPRTPPDSTMPNEGDGVIGEVMVYLVVFRDGVCTVSGLPFATPSRVFTALVSFL
jgi:hypothetical protein